MENPTTLKLEHQNSLINELHNFIALNFPEGTVLFSQIFIKGLILLFIFFLLEIFQRKILLKIAQRTAPNSKNIWMKTFMKKYVFTSFFSLVPLGICYLLVPFIFYHHPQSFHIIDLLFSVFLIGFIARFFISMINAFTDIKNRDQSYRTIALKTFTEVLKIIIVMIAGFIIISILFNLTSAKIFTFLGAIMAIILLIFRDPLLGVVAGVNIASSRQIKVGDWIAIPKHNVDGNVKDINLITTKIQNSDKTISTIPTYDLISTEVKNYEYMRSSNTRRIKRSLLFNFKSLKFIDDDLFEELMKIDILYDYLENKKKEIKEYNRLNLQYPEMPGNGRDLTNIGVFRYYVREYLEKNPDLSKEDTIIVRELEPTVYGLPLEIYCFASTVDWIEYENIQADLFDHIIAISKQFQLEMVMVAPA